MGREWDWSGARKKPIISHCKGCGLELHSYSSRPKKRCTPCRQKRIQRRLQRKANKQFKQGDTDAGFATLREAMTHEKNANKNNRRTYKKHGQFPAPGYRPPPKPEKRTIGPHSARQSTKPPPRWKP